MKDNNISSHTIITHGIPDLQLDLLVVDIDHSGAKLNTNGQIVHRLESLIRELEQ